MHREISIFAIMTLCFGLVFGSVINVANSQVDKQQILIKDNIKSYEDYGLTFDPNYENTYTPLKVFDNLLPTNNITHTLWSKYGDAGFVIDLNNPLDKQICSAEIIVHNPKNSPFQLTVGNKAVEGILDSTNKQVSFFPNCVSDVSQIKFDVISPEKWTSISEIKLFTQKTVPPIEPPVCPPGSYWDNNLKKCVEINNPIENGTAIVNSTISLTVSNSTITINADENSKVIANNPTILSPNKITIPEPEEDTDNNNDDNDEPEEEEQEELEDIEKEDVNKK